MKKSDSANTSASLQVFGDGSIHVLMLGMEVNDHHGRRFIVTKQDGDYMWISRSTWWRRMYWRIRRKFV